MEKKLYFYRDSNMIFPHLFSDLPDRVMRTLFMIMEACKSQSSHFTNDENGSECTTLSIYR